MNSTSTDFLAAQVADNRIIYFKRLIREFEKGGLRGLRNVHKSEISVTLDCYHHPNDVSIEEIYWYFSDCLQNKQMNGDKFRTEESPITLKKLRMLSSIRKDYVIDISDFYDEMLGISTKEMTMSENVTIPDKNKRRLWNIEILTNKRCISDVISQEERSVEDRRRHPNDNSITNFHSTKLRCKNNENLQSKSKYDFTLNNEVDNDSFGKNYEYFARSNTNMMNKEINYSDFNNGIEPRITPKGKYSNNISSRGSYNWNKSSEHISHHPVFSEERIQLREARSFKKYSAKDNNVKIIKTMKSISKIGSEDRLLKPSSSVTLRISQRWNHPHSRERITHKINVDNKMNFSIENISGRDSPNKPQDDIYYQKLYRPSSNHSNEFRYRSNSHQSKLGSESRRTNRERSIEMISKGNYGRKRTSQKYMDVASTKEDENINFYKRVKERQANMRSREFDKLYEDSIEGNLKSPPMIELPSTNCVIKLESRGDVSRRSLADQIHKYSGNINKQAYNNLESLNSSRSLQNSHNLRASTVLEKEIPDEGKMFIIISNRKCSKTRTTHIEDK